MAFGNFLQGFKNFFGPNNRFFNGAREEAPSTGDYYAEQPAPAYPQESTFSTQAQQNAYYQPVQQGGYYGQQPAQPGYQQPAYQQQQQPAQPVYQQPGYQQQQAAYQQPAQPAYTGEFQQQTVNQAYVPPRNRRSAQREARENVVPFPGMTQAQQQPQLQPQPIPEQPAAEEKKLSACVINVRNIGDCRSAIGILRTGDCVVAVIDSIADQSEVRRYVDTLNGACFSLGCTMTRTSSRVGVYFLAPAGMQVLTDQTTTQMNSQSRAPQRARSAFTPPQYTAARPQPSQQPHYQAPQAGYAPVQQPVYPQQPQAGFAAQEPAQGYSPDQNAMAYQQDAVI